LFKDQSTGCDTSSTSKTDFSATLRHWKGLSVDLGDNLPFNGQSHRRKIVD